MKTLLSALSLCCLISCAHGPKVRFADDSGEANTLWLCRPDPKHKGDLECVDLRTLVSDGDVEIETDKNGPPQMHSVKPPLHSGRSDM